MNNMNSHALYGANGGFNMLVWKNKYATMEETFQSVTFVG